MNTNVETGARKGWKLELVSWVLEGDMRGVDLTYRIKSPYISSEIAALETTG